SELRFLLEDAGFDVDLAVDGLAALTSLREGLPHLIVTDLQMPRMDGLALVEAVRTEYPSVPDVLITAHGSEDIAASALPVGAASYVPKRYLSQDLPQVVQQIIAIAALDAEQERIVDSLEEMRFRFAMENDGSLVAPLIRRLEKVVLEMDL